MSGEVSFKKQATAKANTHSLRGVGCESALKSLEYNPKPDDLSESRVKYDFCYMEARRGATYKCSSNFRLGVKSQSSPDIAGSYRSWPQSSVIRDS